MFKQLRSVIDVHVCLNDDWLKSLQIIEHNVPSSNMIINIAGIVQPASV